MSNEINKRVDRIRTFFKKVQPQNHPIKDHPVAGCDEYVKGIYFDMLCVIAMYENDDTENQNRFIQRLMAGSDDTLTITDHIKRTMEITTEKTSEFITQVQSNDLVYIFFIDSLIISCANGLPNRKQTEFLAELGDTLGLNKASIKFCSELAVGILEQDFDKIKDSVSRYKNVETIVESADCYIKPLINNNITSNDNCMYYYSLVRGNKAFFKEEKLFKNCDSVVLENLKIDKRIYFNSIKEVKIIGCLFENISELISVLFSGVQKVIIDNCEFRNLKSVLSFDSENTNVIISNSYFYDCHATDMYSGSSTEGCIICSKKKTQITFNTWVFKNISAAHHAGIISTDNNVTVQSCQFFNCNSGAYLFYMRKNRYDNKSKIVIIGENICTNCVQLEYTNNGW